MKVLSQKDHLNECLTRFPNDKDLIEKVISGEIKREDEIINDSGMTFLFLGPCNICSQYNTAYVTINITDDYCRDVEGLMCRCCVKKAMSII